VSGNAAGFTVGNGKMFSGGGWTGIGPAAILTLTLTDPGGATGLVGFYRVLVSP
jgi:hypothetical protein